MSARTLIRDAASRAFPKPVTELMLRVWRRLYWWNRLRDRPMQARRLVKTMLASGRPFTVELGAPSRVGVPDWITLDLNGTADVKHDLTLPLPFPDGSVDRVYSSHVLEHFTYPTELLPLLRECHRILKPGGVISSAVPNARLYLEAYFHPENFDRERFCGWEVGLHYTSRIDVVNFIAYLGGEHKVLFDEENFPRILEEAGFRDARLRAYDPAIDLPERRHESLYTEAVR